MRRSLHIGLFIILIFMQNYKSHSQTPAVNKYPIAAESFQIDHLNNIYAISSSTVSKYDAAGKLLYEYSNPQAGNITTVDVSDPLRILCFFEDQNELLFLNQQLALIAGPFYFDDLDIFNVAAICATSHNRFWVFDSQNFKLVQFNQQLSISQQGTSLSSILNDDDLPIQLVDNNNLLYLNIKSKGILVFDQFGTYIKTIPIKDILHFSVSKDKLVAQRSNREIISYSLKTFDQEQHEFDLPNNISFTQYINKQLYISDKQYIYKYHL